MKNRLALISSYALLNENYYVCVRCLPRFGDYAGKIVEYHISSTTKLSRGQKVVKRQTSCHIIYAATFFPVYSGILRIMPLFATLVSQLQYNKDYPVSRASD